jgi:hypothetical protein
MTLMRLPLKIGDRVHRNDDNTRIGTVIEINVDGYKARVNWGHNRTYFKISSLVQVLPSADN